MVLQTNLAIDIKTVTVYIIVEIHFCVKFCKWANTRKLFHCDLGASVMKTHGAAVDRPMIMVAEGVSPRPQESGSFIITHQVFGQMLPCCCPCIF